MPGARKLLLGFTIGVVAAAVALALWGGDVLEPWETRTWDWRARLLAAPGQASDDVVMILLDQNSLDWAAKENGLTWPWPREVYGAIVDYCRMAGAGALAFDVLFTESSAYGVDDDRALSATLSHFGRVAAAVFPGKSSGDQQQWPASAPVPALSTVDGDNAGSHPAVESIQFPRATFPIPEVYQSVAVLGSVSMAPDPDGIYRRVTVINRFDGKLLPLLGLSPILVSRQAIPVQFTPSAIVLGGRRIPTDPEGRALLRYRGPSGTHRSFSAAAVIQSYLRLQAGETPVIDPEAFRDKTVFFGFSAPGLFDLRSAPVDGVYPGVEIHATALDNFLSGDFLRHPSAALNVTVVMLLAVAAALTVTFFPNPVSVTLACTAYVSLPALLGIVAYTLGFWLQVVVQVVAVCLSIAVALVVNYATEGRQKRFIKNAFGQYLSPAVIDALIRNPDKLKLGGERRVLSIFFSDLQGFTSISEGLEPEALTTLLNDYLSAMTDIIHDENGTVDKYEGDAIIAFWNAPLAVPDHAPRIVRAALRCQTRLAELRPAFYQRIGKEMQMRIGINTGPAVVGNMGSRTRFDYTMLGDAVNLAARLEGVNKQFGTYTMISDATRKMMGDEFAVRELARVAVVGKKKPVVVFEPMLPEAYEMKAPLLSTFQKGLNHFYEGRFAEAADIFSQISAEDPPAAKYLIKCRELIAAPPKEWEGVWVMSSK